MDYEQINQQLKPILEYLILELKKLNDRLCVLMDYYKENHQDWCLEGDFRPGSISRILSSIVSSKFTSTKILEYLNNDNWPDDYRKNHMPSPWKVNDYFGHFKGVALLIRFHLLHSIYSNIETTNRIIIRKKNLRTNAKPAEIVSEITNTYDVEFIKFIDFIRNSIHNNGFHYPKNPNNNNWTYAFNDKTFVFEIGERIDLQFPDLIAIINRMIDEHIETLKHQEIMNIELFKDYS